MIKLSTVFLFFLALPTSICARQLSSLITDSRVLATDNSTERQRFSDAQIAQLLNDAQRQAISVTWCLEKSVQFELVAGTTYYSLPSDFLAFRRVTRDHMLLNEMTPAALDSKSEGWEEASGLATYYFVNFSSPSKIGVAPFPQTSTDTGTIRMDYFQQPTDMSASVDQPFNGVITLYPYHNALAYYAASRMASIDGRMDVSPLFLQQYAAYVDQMKNKCKERPNYLPGARSSP